MSDGPQADALTLVQPLWPQGWSVPANLRVPCTTTEGQSGSAEAPYGGFNLALHVADEPQRVQDNRQRLRRSANVPPIQWLTQVHGQQVLSASAETAQLELEPPKADASMVSGPGIALSILTADCLPIVLFEPRGQVIANLHAGWRGLVSGIIASTVAALSERAAPAASDGLPWMAWIGPGISAAHYEVAPEVVAQVRGCLPAEDVQGVLSTEAAQGKAHLDLAQLAKRLLAASGIRRVSASGLCSYADPRFYSHRRASQQGLVHTGRMATLAWLEGS